MNDIIILISQHHVRCIMNI